MESFSLLEEVIKLSRYAVELFIVSRFIAMRKEMLGMSGSDTLPILVKFVSPREESTLYPSRKMQQY
jgi:hypothetical protein